MALLTVTLDAQNVAETAGINATFATVERYGTDVKLPLTVQLSSSDPAHATVPSTAVIPAGETTVTFPISVINDHANSGSHVVTISASGLDSTPLSWMNYRLPDQSYGVAIALDAAGRVITAGNNVIRYTSGGSIDSTFGGSELVTPGYVSRGVAVQADGKVVVAGSAYQQNLYGFALTRYDSDGTLDLGFGTNGQVFLSPSSGIYNEIRSIRIQPDGKILVGGNVDNAAPTNADFCVARFNPDGSIDTSFGTNGIASTSFSDGIDRGFAMELQADGKVVLVGSSLGGDANSQFALMRLTKGGLLDPTFGVGGKLQTNIPGSYELADALAIQPDGKLVVAGYVASDTAYKVVLARYTPTGALDVGFGNEGVAFAPFEGNPRQAGPINSAGLTVQPDGRIVFVGKAIQDFSLVVRFFQDGSFDTALNGVLSEKFTGVVARDDGQLFVIGGNYLQSIQAFGQISGSDTLNVVEVDAPAPSLTVSIASDSVVETAGPFATTGTVTRVGTDTKMALTVRLISSDPARVSVPATVVIPAGQTSAEFTVGVAADGDSNPNEVTISASAVDSTPLDPELEYGINGEARLARPQHYFDWDIALQADGKVITVGDSITRLNLDGSVETTFASTNPSEEFQGAYGLAVQGDGKVLTVIRDANGSYRLYRFEPDGTIDGQFGSGGTVDLIPTEGVDQQQFMTIRVQADGKILIGATYYYGTTNEGYFGVTRFNADGSLDVGFGDGGTSLTNFSGHYDRGLAMELQADGKIVMVGTSLAYSSGANFALIRLTTAGQLDATFGVDGKLQTDVPGDLDVATSVAIQPDGKLVVAGYAAVIADHEYKYGVVLARYSSSGELDPSFGVGGIANNFGGMPYLAGTFEHYGLALQPDGRILFSGKGGGTDGGAI